MARFINPTGKKDFFRKRIRKSSVEMIKVNILQDEEDELQKGFVSFLRIEPSI